MGEKEVRADLPRQALQVLVGPGGQDIPVKAGFIPFAVPGHAKAIAIGAGLGFMGIMALGDQRMTGRGNDIFKIELWSKIGCPTTHESPGFDHNDRQYRANARLGIARMG